MKALLIIFIILVNIVSFIIIAADINYQKAVQSASYSEGTDQAIETVMSKYGFDKDWQHKYTTIEKVEALFKVN